MKKYLCNLDFLIDQDTYILQNPSNSYIIVIVINIFPRFIFSIFSFPFLLFLSCKISKSHISREYNLTNVEDLISDKNPVFKNSFTGFILFDLKNKKEEDKY